MSEFNEQLIESMRRQLEQLSRRLQHVEQQQDTPYTQVYLGKTDGSGITARSGTTMGSGTVTIYTGDSGTLAVLQDNAQPSPNDITHTVYNISASAVAANAYVLIGQEMVTGVLVAMVEDCGA